VRDFLRKNGGIEKNGGRKGKEKRSFLTGTFGDIGKRRGGAMGGGNSSRIPPWEKGGG